MSATVESGNRARVVAAVALVMTVALAQGCAPSISDTGFSGRWQRGGGPDMAEVAIWEDATGWHFCWSATRDDDGPQYLCADDGATVLSEGGEVTYRYDVRMNAGPGEREATVEIVGEPVLDGLTPIRWIDRLELQPDGRTILSWKVELNGVPLDPPRGPLQLDKIANEPR